MKNTFLLLLLFTGIVKGQIVNIPDATFKNTLVNTNCISLDNDDIGEIDADSNNDGEIDYVEAATVTNLILSNANITDLTGIEAFININRLICDHNQLTSINITGLSLLSALELNSNPITTINTTGLTQLWYLGCSSTPVTSLDFTTNPNFGGLDANYCTGLLSLNASGTHLSGANLYGTTYLEHLNFHGCPLNGGAVSSYLIDMGNLITLDLAGIQGITFLSFGGTSLDISGCTSIQQLFIHGPANNIDISSFVNLTDLELRNGNLTSLDLTPLTNLRYINCSDNQLTNLVLPTQNNLTEVWCENNQLSTINTTGSPMLERFFLSGNLVATLDTSGLPNLQVFECSSNPISALNLYNNPQLSYLYCPNSPIASLDLSLNRNLTTVYCGSPELTSLTLKNGANETLTLTSSPNLHFICADDNQVTTLQTVADAHAAVGCVVNSYCSFTPGGNYNKITGHCIYDADNNGCDSNDTQFPFNIRLNVVGDTSNGGTFLNPAGEFTFYTATGNYTLIPYLEHAEYFTVTPVNPTVNFPLLDNSVQTQNFCISPSGLHSDLEVILTPLAPARPGGNASYKIIFKNNGTTTINGAISLAFDDARTNLISAFPVVDSQTFGNLSWDFSSMYPFETRVINFTLNLNTPFGNPPVFGGTILNFIASSSYILGEGTPYDNTFEINQTVVNSVDPNDKTCLEGDTISLEDIGKYVHYNINFENIGSADALNVVVKDVIDTTMFDINSLQLLYASHPVETKINGNTVEFVFENINLPSSISNPIGGHGNVLFKIKTLPTLHVGDMVSNTANIFFDYNAPIATNEARTNIAALTTKGYVKDASVTLYPNPTENLVTISANTNLKSIQLFDIQGRLLQTVLEHKKTTTLNLSNKSKGTYLVKITTEKGSTVEKVIKE